MSDYSKPIKTLEQAKAFIRSLSDSGLLFHFDDGAFDCLARHGLVSHAQAIAINKRVDECFALDWGDRYECPLGYCLEVGDLRKRFCGLNASWSVDAWHYGPGDKPNTVSGDLYVYDNELSEPMFTVAVVHYNDFTGDTIITPLSDHRTLSDAHNDALAMVARRFDAADGEPPQETTGCDADCWCDACLAADEAQAQTAMSSNNTRAKLLDSEFVTIMLALGERTSRSRHEA
jgi:hypothetical protein